MSRRSAFTFLELLLAMTLTALLMVGVLAVISRVMGPSSELSVHEDANSSAVPGDSGWVRLLRRDLEHARAVTANADGDLVMAGYLALDATNHGLTHRPAVVTYHVEPVAGRHWLVRRQALLDVLSTDNVRRDLVCHGVRRLQLVRNGQPLEPVSSSDAEAQNALVGGLLDALQAAKPPSGRDQLNAGVDPNTADPNATLADPNESSASAIATSDTESNLARAAYVRRQALAARFKWAYVIGDEGSNYRWQAIDMRNFDLVEDNIERLIQERDRAERRGDQHLADERNDTAQMLRRKLEQFRETVGDGNQTTAANPDAPYPLAQTLWELQVWSVGTQHASSDGDEAPEPQWLLIQQGGGL